MYRDNLISLPGFRIKQSLRLSASKKKNFDELIFMKHLEQRCLAHSKHFLCLLNKLNK